MSGASCARRRAFTLVEMLVVIAVIGVLLSIVLPVMAKARESAVRVECASNLRQCGLILEYYAYDHRNHVPPSAPRHTVVASAFYIPSASYDLRNYLDNYVDNYRVWQCPAMSDATPIDDPRNTRHTNYGTYSYWPGRTFPNFSTSDPVPTWTMAIESPAQQVVMQDLYDRSTTLERFNHGRGEVLVLPNDNPSVQLLQGPEPGDGANLQYFDGHVKWLTRSELKPVGQALQGLSLDAMSDMP